MTQTEFQNELHYGLSLNIIKKMLEKGLITTEEFHKIDLLNRQSFSPKLAKIMA